MIRGSESVRHQLAQFEAFEGTLPPHEPSWLVALRKEAIGLFAEQGFPHRKLEDWRYTNLAGLEKQRFARATRSEVAGARLAQISLPDGPAERLVLLDGRVHSHQPGADASRVVSLAALCGDAGARGTLLERLGTAASCKEDSFTALNTAFLEDGAVVRIPARSRGDTPIHLLFAASGSGTAVHPRVLVVAEPGSYGLVLLDHVSLAADATGLTNSVIEVFVGAGARLDLVLLQREGSELFHVSSLHALQERDSHLTTHTLSLGGGLVRNQLTSRLVEEGASVQLQGLFITSGRQHVDNQTLVEHAAAHCSSRELYKGVLGGRSHGVFRGRVVVSPGAQKTDAEQSSRHLLLTDQAEIDTKPQLEIYADDVKCGHGSSIGQLDAEALFFLRARGLGEARARALLTEGFVREIVEGLPSRELVALATACVDERLHGSTDGLLEGGDRR